MDLNKFSLDELNTLAIDIRRAIDSRRQEAEQQLLADIRQKAQRLGLTPDQLISRVRSGKKTAASAPLSTRYRNPETGAEWSGRGRKPSWVVQWIDSGRLVDQLAIA